jgi:hypothetical protein
VRLAGLPPPSRSLADLARRYVQLSNAPVSCKSSARPPHTQHWAPRVSRRHSRRLMAARQERAAPLLTGQRSCPLEEADHGRSAGADGARPDTAGDDGAEPRSANKRAAKAVQKRVGAALRQMRRKGAGGGRAADGRSGWVAVLGTAQRGGAARPQTPIA